MSLHYLGKVKSSDLPLIMEVSLRSGHMATKQSRPQSSGLQDMGRRPGASLPVTGVQYRRTEAAFASCLACHGPKHH